MKELSEIESKIYEKNSDQRGAMLLMLWGEQGSMKTMSMTRMVMIDMGVDNVGDEFKEENIRRIPLWKAQQSCQWILLAANDLPITYWIHESVNDYTFKLKGSKRSGIKSRKIDPRDMEGLDIEFKEFSEPEEIVEGIEPDRVNAYFIPGSSGNEADKYFYQKTTLELCQALNERDYGDHVTLNWDEIQNEAPDKTNGDFYELQMSSFPTEWEDFRKNRITLRGTGHSHNEVNWKLHKNKVTGTVYLKKGQVHSRHTEVSQSAVNDMRPGQFVVDGYQPGEFDMPQLPAKEFGWMPDHPDVKLKMEVDYTVPDVRPTNMDVEKWIDSQPFTQDHLDDLVDADEAADIIDITSRVVKRKFQKGEIPAIKLDGKWFTSMTVLVNQEAVPS